jgi:RNA polymerase sigma-70 factor (ECF subfamily)
VTLSADGELVALLRHRDPRGFERAYAAYAAPLLGFLRRLSGRPELADDLLQHVFLRLAERGPELRRDSDLRAWLYTVARNAYLTHVRRSPALAEEAALEALASPPPDVEARLLLGDVERALGALRLEDREVLLLLAVEELDRDAVAQLLGVDQVALRQRLSRARSRLLAELEREAPRARSDTRKTLP